MKDEHLCAKLLLSRNIGNPTLFPLLKAFLIAIPALNFKASRTEAIKVPQVVSAAIHLIL